MIFLPKTFAMCVLAMIIAIICQVENVMPIVSFFIGILWTSYTIRVAIKEK